MVKNIKTYLLTMSLINEVNCLKEPKHYILKRMTDYKTQRNLIRRSY
jgi:hypothetical protein